MTTRAVYATVFFAVCAAVLTVWLVKGGAAKPTEVSTPQPPVDDDNPKPSLTGPHPKAVADETEYDFGVMEFGEHGRHVFILKNEGEAPLNLVAREEDSTCKCTIGKLDKNGLLPGESTKVELNWDMKDFFNQSFEHGALVRTNDPDRTEIKFVIKGKVVRSLMLIPKDEWVVPNVSEDEPTEITGTIFSKNLDQFQIGKIDFSTPLVTAKWRPLTDTELAQLVRSAKENFGMEAMAITDPDDFQPDMDSLLKKIPPPKCGFEITVRVAPDIPIGKFRETMTIHTDVDKVKTLKAYIRGSRPSPFQIFSARGGQWISKHNLLRMGRFPASKGKQATLSVFVRGSDELKTLDVESDPDFIKCSFERDLTFAGNKSQRYELTVEIPPGGPAMSRTYLNRASVLLKIDHPEEKLIRLHVEFLSF